MKFKIEWCTDDKTPYIEQDLEYFNVPTEIYLTPNPPMIKIESPSVSMLTKNARSELSGYVEDIRHKLTTLHIHLVPDTNEITFIDWL